MNSYQIKNSNVKNTQHKQKEAMKFKMKASLRVENNCLAMTQNLKAIKVEINKSIIKVKIQK